MTKVILSAACLVGSLLFSCRKGPAPDRKTLEGRWELSETFDPYGPPGSRTGSPAPAESRHTIEFGTGGQYARAEGAAGNFQRCFGTYRLIHQKDLVLYSTCAPPVESVTISELTGEELVIDRTGTEGVIRYKYRRAGPWPYRPSGVISAR